MLKGLNAQNKDVLKDIYVDFNHEQNADKNTEWVQAIQIIDPACRSEVKGLVTVKFTRCGYGRSQSFLLAATNGRKSGRVGT